MLASVFSGFRHNIIRTDAVLIQLRARSNCITLFGSCRIKTGPVNGRETSCSDMLYDFCDPDTDIKPTDTDSSERHIPLKGSADQPG